MQLHWTKDCSGINWGLMLWGCWEMALFCVRVYIYACVGGSVHGHEQYVMYVICAFGWAVFLNSFKRGCEHLFVHLKKKEQKSTENVTRWKESIWLFQALKKRMRWSATYKLHRTSFLRHSNWLHSVVAPLSCSRIPVPALSSNWIEERTSPNNEVQSIN